MRSIPPIRTARVTLRAMIPQDFERYASMWACPETVAYVGGQPGDHTRAWASFLRNAGHWSMVGYGQWALQPHGTQSLAGQVGFFLGRFGLGEDFDPYPEAGWVLHPDWQGQGLGEEAARAAHDWFDRVVTGPLVCRIAPGHGRSLQIAEALGYVPLRDIAQDGAAVRLLKRHAPPGGPRNILAPAEETPPVRPSGQVR